MLNVIVILGPRRTGTTLPNQILCNAPDTNPHIGECQLLTRICSTFKWAQDSYDRVVQWYFDNPQAMQVYFKGQVNEFLRIAAEHHDGVSNLVLKSPELSNYKCELDALIPEARQIVCIRDPRDQIASELQVGKRQLEKGIDADSARAYKSRNIELLCRKYLKSYESVLQGESANTMIVRYEDILLDLQTTLSTLEEFTRLQLSGFNPDSSWTRFEHKEHLSKMPAYVEQYGSPLDKSRVGRYRQSLSQNEIALIEKECHSILSDRYSEQQ